MVSCPTNDTVGICSTLESAGLGIGVLLQSLSTPLVFFLIMLGIVGGVVAIVFAIAAVIRKAIGSTHSHR